MNSVHQVAQAVAPDSRVVYVDHDPGVLAHSRNLLQGNDRAAIIGRDLRDPAGILADPQLRALLDFGQPVAVLMVAVLHFISDEEDPHGLVASLMDPMPAGSFLVVSHFTADSYAQADVAAQEYENATSALHSRRRSQVIRFFSGYEMTAPGSVVWTPQWRRGVDGAEDDPELAAHPGRALFWCGVGRKVTAGRPEDLPPVTAPPAAARPADLPPATMRPADFPPPPVAAPGPAVPFFGAPVAADRVSAPDYPQLRADIPNVARMYDYMLGGKDHYPADRAAAQRTFAVLGEDVVRGTAQQNRQFLGRAVRYLAAQLGIRQFLDIGTGLPTMNSVHEVTRLVAPDSRVVYVDNDAVVLAHARDMLNAVDGTVITRHDLRDPEAIVADPQVRALLNFGEPVAVLLIAILHFIADADDPAALVARLMAVMPPGSCLVISHLTAEHYTHADRAAEVYADTTPGLHLRSRAAIEALFGGLPLLAPGELVYTADWHPDEDTAPASAPGGSSMLCGIAFKP